MSNISQSLFHIIIIIQSAKKGGISNDHTIINTLDSVTSICCQCYMCDLDFCVEFTLLSNYMSSCFKFSLLLCSLPIPHNNGLCRLYSYLFCGRFVLSLCYLYLFTYTGAQHNYRMMSVSLNSNIMNATDRLISPRF